MKCTVVCVGKLKERFWKDACAEYTKRLRAYAKVDMREVADIDPAKAGGGEAEDTGDLLRRRQIGVDDDIQPDLPLEDIRIPAVLDVAVSPRMDGDEFEVRPETKFINSSNI